MKKTAPEPIEEIDPLPKSLRRYRPWLLFLASSFVFLAAFPPFNLGLLVFLALVPWLGALNSASRKQTGWGGFLWGLIVVGFEMGWIPKLVAQWVPDSPLLGYLPWLVCTFIGGLYYAFLARVMRQAMLRQWWWALPLLWAGFEIFRSYIPGVAFPFFILATPLWRFPVLIAGAFYGTIYLISAAVVAVNLLVYGWLARIGYRPLRGVIISVFLLVIATTFRYTRETKGHTVIVAAGQPGVDMAFGDPTTRSQRLMGNIDYLIEKAKANHARLLVLPEGMAQTDGQGVPTQLPFHLDPSLPTIFGGMRYELSGPIGGQNQVRQFQSAFTFTNGKWEHVDKARLVVFGEYVPGRGIIPFLDKFHLGANDLTPGDRTRTIRVDGLEVGPMICFEGLFWDVAQKQVENNADILAVMSIDDWYMGTPAPDQLRSASVWRAVEIGLPVVRAAATGYTMGVDQWGKVIDEAPLRTPTALPLRLYIPDVKEPQPPRYLFPWLLGLSLPILTLLLAILRKKPPESQGQNG